MVARTPTVVLLVATTALGLAGCERTAPAVDPPALPTVTVAKAVLREVTDYFEFPGQTEAVGEVEVRARVTGYIVNVNFEDGQEVKKGDVLFEIDPRPYEAMLDKAKGDLERLQALLAKAERDLARSDRLRPSGAISEDEYEQHVSLLNVHKASILSGKAAVRDAELNLEFTRVVSPIDGQVSRRRITEGNLVQTGSNQSTVLTTVVTVDPVYVSFHIEEPALLKYRNLDWRLGQDGRPKQLRGLQVPVEIGLPKEEGFPHRGVVDFLDNKVDRFTGTIVARGVFDNASRYLTPGMFVRVRVPFGEARQALLVSERAIASDQRQKYVLTVNQDNVVQRRNVKLGSLQKDMKLGSPQKDMRVIESGIEPGDLVVVSGLQRARPGMTVKPRFEEEDAAPAPDTAEAAGKPDTAEAAQKR